MEQQSILMLRRARDLLVRQRTMLINALRAHLAEFGLVAGKGPAGVEALKKKVEEIVQRSRSADFIKASCANRPYP